MEIIAFIFGLISSLLMFWLVIEVIRFLRKHNQ